MSKSGENLDTSLGHGAMSCGSEMVRFVVTGSLSEEDPVARYDDDTVLVSASLPTRPSTYPDKQSQFQAVRAFINEERVAKGLSPMGSRPTFATEEEIKAQIEAEQSASE